MLNAIYQDKDNKINMVEFNSIVYPVTLDNKKIKPQYETKIVKEHFLNDNIIITHWKDGENDILTIEQDESFTEIKV